jgi:RNA polymerase sigma-70 factor (ECF subfamily)
MGSDLLRFLRARLASAHDAEDLAQEVYLRLMRVTDNERIRNPRAYILRVAANVVHEWRLLARNRLAHSAELLDHLPGIQDTANEADIQRQTRELEAALATLSPKCRAVVLMHRRDHYTYEEIAASLDISVSMVKKYLVKGLSVCQARVGWDPLRLERPLQPGVSRNG